MDKTYCKMLSVVAALWGMVCADVVAAPDEKPVMTWIDSTYIKVEMPLCAGGVEVKSDYRIIVTPRLVGEDGNETVLPAVEFAGKRNRKYNDRLAALDKVMRGSVYAPGDTAMYVAEVPVEDWMLRTPLSLEVTREKEGCCNVELLSSESVAGTRYFAPFIPLDNPVVPRRSVAERLAETEKVLRPVDTYAPYDPAVPLRKMEGALYVHFPVNKYDLNPDYRDNAETLHKIIEILSAIEPDDMSRVVKVVVIGLASPEGPLALNKRLSRKRAEALKDYVLERVNINPGCFEVTGGGEAWADLRDMIADSGLEGKDEVLRVLDETADVNERERILRRIDGGRVFEYLKQQIFVDQRNAGYIRVYYDADMDEGAMLINKASRLIAAGRSDEAAKMLEPLDDERKYNVLGKAYFMLGRKDKAMECFSKAAESGDESAARNLREVKMREEYK